MKKTPLRRKSTLSAISNKELKLIELKVELIKKDQAFYKRLWNDSDKRCLVTRRHLGNEPLTTFFHHLLPKAKYPEYRHCDWNIVIISPDIHNQIEIHPDKVPTIRDMSLQLVERHRRGELEKCP